MDAASKYFTKGATFWYEAVAAYTEMSNFSWMIDHYLSLVSMISKHFT